MQAVGHPSRVRFQSTLSMRRATGRGFLRAWPDRISIHALHEESDISSTCNSITVRWISIHALHEESDAWTPFADMANYKFQSTLSMRRATSLQITANHCNYRFQSTLSMRRATRCPAGAVACVDISIHALHEESDNRCHNCRKPSIAFQSTLSMRRATNARSREIAAILISIHALHEESDRRGSAVWRRALDFNPRSP